MRKLLCTLYLLTLSVCLVSCKDRFVIRREAQEKESSFWMSSMKDEIFESLKKPINNKVAKNIVIFLGDGMGITATTAGRIYKGQKKGHSGEESSLAWEHFPNVALLKTYNLDKQVPDSAATATAFFGGVKANYYTVGVNGQVAKKDCQKALDQSTWVSSVLQWAQEAGKDTGVVTTARITHATPAALYAHSADRFWECDSKLEPDSDCKDIARQLVEDLPGRDINVVLAGGRRQLGSPLPGDEGSCERTDGRNLVNEWKAEKEAKGKSTAYVTSTEQLLNVDVQSTEHVMGLFGGSHMSYESERDTSPKGSPSLSQMTEFALRRLKTKEEGFFLMVEGGRIDHGLHDSKPGQALEEVVAFDAAIESALKIIGGDDETLVIVTADHSHVMTINGYPDRGNNILGKTTYKYVTDDMPYPTLMFTTGYGFNNAYEWNDTHVVRKNLTDVDTTDVNYVSPSVVPTESDSETHGGEDVAAYATGPMAHLFQKVHEQAYVAHVMGFAACIGPYKTGCTRYHADSVYTLDESLAYYKGTATISGVNRLYIFSLVLSVFYLNSLC